MASSARGLYVPSPSNYPKPVPRTVLRSSGELIKGARYTLNPATNGTMPERGQKAPAAQSSKRTKSEIAKWIQNARQYWEPRNLRFRDDQRLYQLLRDMRTARSDDLILLSDPKLLIKKVARLLARHGPKIDVAPSPGVTDATIPQKIENFLYAFDQSLNYKWMEGLHNPFRYDQAFLLVLRGWITERLMFYPDGYDDMETGDYSALYRHDVIDPALVYPVVAGNEITRVIHSYATTVGELKDDKLLYSKDVPKIIADRDEFTDVMCHAVYWKDNGSWWHAILVTGGILGVGSDPTTGEWLKSPTELGYNPWTILTANGASYRGTDWDWTTYVKEIGTGLLDESADTIKAMSKMATKLSELLSLEANPPATVYLDDEGTPDIRFLPGSRNYLTQRDKLELHKVGPQAGDYRILWDILSQRLSRATLPPAFFAEFVEGGFSAATIMAAGKDILFPFVEAINTADKGRYKKALELYRDLGPSKPLRSHTNPGAENEVTSAEIYEYDIRTQGVYCDVTREDMTPQEQIARINAGLALLRDKVISIDRMRKEYADIKNPAAENRQVIAEMVYMNEDVIKKLVPAALAQTGKEQLARIYEMVMNPAAPAMAEGGAGAGGGAPQMDPSLAQSQGMPLGGAMPTGMMPPQMNNGLDPNVAFQNPILQQLMAQASGGGGAGGTPPIPGTGSPIPPMSPFFR